MSLEKVVSDIAQVPQHIAIIMDGNTRWAQQRCLAPIDGHKEGAEALRAVVEYCAEIGVEYVTAFAFSSENWQRSEEEVAGLMELFLDSLERESGQFSENHVRLRFIGQRSRFAPEMQELMASIEEQQPGDVRMTLILAIDYGGRQDVVSACKQLASQVQQGSCSVDDINEERLSSVLSLADVPDPELCIRTSDERRVSNFLLWQLAYSELYFSPVLWPDFKPQDMKQAIVEFFLRKRRYGKSSVSTT